MKWVKDEQSLQVLQQFLERFFSPILLRRYVLYVQKTYSLSNIRFIYLKKGKRKIRYKLNRIIQNFKIFPNVTKSYEEAIGNFKLT